jgi:hypothetical protein
LFKIFRACPVHQRGESLAVSAVLLVVSDTLFDHTKYRISTINTGQFFCQSGVAAKLATDQKAITAPAA